MSVRGTSAHPVLRCPVSWQTTDHGRLPHARTTQRPWPSSFRHLPAKRWASGITGRGIRLAETESHLLHLHIACM
ncbi:Uncharacterized protein BANIM336_00843 [Bifidobacterium animalis subsp. animalis IM386]|uniref:Uncharacterized protein n=1 Tax=Bifidobacterium animalis subsp. animalis IM386 TaxID=1402194 RepID=A0AAV2W2W5_9BIFI|nr:Uncharacterized protein BANIM336_00843 [Bifidobacterium animalis subsp. animalis IM386]